MLAGRSDHSRPSSRICGQDIVITAVSVESESHERITARRQRLLRLIPRQGMPLLHHQMDGPDGWPARGSGRQESRCAEGRLGYEGRKGECPAVGPAARPVCADGPGARPTTRAGLAANPLRSDSSCGRARGHHRPPEHVPRPLGWCRAGFDVARRGPCPRLFGAALGSPAAGHRLQQHQRRRVRLY